MNIILAGGGTGGHIYPGIALAQALVRRDPGVTPWFLCTERPIDDRALTRYGFPRVVMAGQRFRGFRRGGMAALPELMRAYHRAWRTVNRLNPAVVVGLGGYGEVGPALAAFWKRIPVALLEQNVVPGKATRFCARFARRVFCQWDMSERHFRRRPGQFEATGNPLRAEMQPVPRTDALRAFDLTGDRKTLLVMGGSQGAAGVDRILIRHGAPLKDVAARVQVLHLCGAENQARLQALYAQWGVPARVFTYSENMPAIYSVADLAIARAGATTVAEMTAFGIPLILVPYPHAADNHQFHNAIEAAKHKAGFCQPERDWNESWFKNYLDTLLLDERRRLEFARASRSLSRPLAADIVARRVMDLAASVRTAQGAVS